MPLKDYKQTDEHKRKISLAHKDKKLSEEHKRKLSESHKKPIMENKLCESCSLAFYKPVKFSKTQWRITRFCSKKCSGIWMAKIKKGIPAPWSRRPMSDDTKKKHSKAKTKRTPEYKKEYYNLKGLERYARLRGSEGKFTLKEWEEVKCKHHFCCVYCGKSEEEAKLTKDHIIPLTKGGSNWISNIQPLCQSCNSRKYNKIYV